MNKTLEIQGRLSLESWEQEDCWDNLVPETNLWECPRHKPVFDNVVLVLADARGGGIMRVLCSWVLFVHSMHSGILPLGIPRHAISAGWWDSR